MDTIKTTKKADSNGVKAVIATGGKQYFVQEGDTVMIEKVLGDHKEGDKITFNEVLLIINGDDLKIGTPNVADAKVEAVIKEIGRDKKVTVIHYKPKSRYFKKAGHRQPFFKVTVNNIKY